MDSELDRVERECIELIKELERAHQDAMRPHYKRLADILALRPHVWVMDGQTFVPVRLTPERR